MSNDAVEPPANWKEARRLRAWELLQEGWPQKDIAAALGVSRGAVSQWVSKARAGGVPALRHRKPIGGPSKLTAEQRRQLPELLAQGPAAYGFDEVVWTRRRVTEVIRREFGVSYDPTQVGRILRSLGWKPQQQTPWPVPRDE